MKKFKIKRKEKKLSLATKILIGMFAGLVVGLIIKLSPSSHFVNNVIVDGVFSVCGKLFIDLLKMLVVPIVFVSLVCGTGNLGSLDKLGRMGLKTLFWFILTTVIAIIIGLLGATLFHIGTGAHLAFAHSFHHVATPPTLRQTIISLIPSNPISAMAEGNLLQIIIFALLLGVAISLTGRAGAKIADAFNSLNVILMKLIELVMLVAPYGVFFLIAEAFAKIGFGLITDLLVYCLVILLSLILQVFGVYSILLGLVARLNPLHFFKKMYPAMLFGFSTSSSNASIPIVLETTEKKLGAHNSVASFVIPLGATINMDGTAIMQGVATVFIAHIYHVPLTLPAYFAVIATATLASIGTAGVPGVGVITLAMVLQQVGLPVEGIGLIIGVDRLMDMLRTVANITGDAVTACLVSKSEKEFDKNIYNNPH